MSKPFIDRKKAQHFSVVHRSQRDPLIALEDSTPNVLLPVTPLNIKKRTKSKKSKPVTEEGEEIDQESKFNKNALNAAEYGVFVDPSDNYDYTQHMKPMGENPDAVFIEAPNAKPKAKKGVSFDLPEEIFSSKTENPVGLMNQRSVPQEYMDDMDDELRDALIALDDEAYVEDLQDEFFDDLDDDEYIPLEGESDEELGADATWEDRFRQFQRNKSKFDSDDDFEDEDEFDENGLGRFKSSKGFDSKSMASRYSMTSSAMFRNAGLTSLDEQFDRIEAEYNDDDEDDECPEGMPIREDFDDIMNEFLDKYEVIGKKVVTQMEGETGGDKLGILRKILLDTEADESISKAKILESLEEKTKKPSKESELQRPEQKVREVWDAQSILSTYSNIYNHPSLIKEPSKPKIVISSKGFPRVQTEQDQKLQNALDSIDNNNELDDDIDIDAHLAQLTEKINLGAARGKKETAEEKKQRKAAFKELKKSRRVEKKQTKLEFAQKDQVAQEKAAQRANQKHIHLV